MRPIIEIGEALLSDSREGGRDHLLRPSFEAMMSLGTPEEIVEIYATVHRSEAMRLFNRLKSIPDDVCAFIVAQPTREPERVLTAAMRVIEACCDDDLTELVGEWYGDDTGHIVYRPGQLDRDDIILIAQSLLQHGISGKAEIRKLQRHESNETATGFQAFEYISAARAHLGMNREEAGALTMSEFQYLLAAKYPDQKGLTREEYDDLTEKFLRKQEVERLHASGGK